LGDPEMRAVVVNYRDITQRYQTEAALRQERDFAKNLIEAARALVLIVDPDGRIIRFNPYLRQLSGYRLRAVQGREWFDVLLPEPNRPAARAAFRQLLAGQASGGSVGTILTRDGRACTIQWYTRPLAGTESTPRGVLLIGHDITDLVTAQKRALQAER